MSNITTLALKEPTMALQVPPESFFIQKQAMEILTRQPKLITTAGHSKRPKMLQTARQEQVSEITFGTTAEPKKIIPEASGGLIVSTMNVRNAM